MAREIAHKLRAPQQTLLASEGTVHTWYTIYMKTKHISKYLTHTHTHTQILGMRIQRNLVIPAPWEEGSHRIT